jgi:phosphoglycerate dehydrogenase-like enzyme
MSSHPSFHRAEAVVWIPPGPPPLLEELWRGGHLPGLRWAHGFYAGVDAIADFSLALAESDVPLTNGRGAFSSSLAEYAITAALHFNKQIPRCMGNRVARKWDKFVMAELRGKTLGLVGYGDIAKATARLARAFGMRVVALRRNASKADDPEGLVGPYDGPVQQTHKHALFSEADVVVCSLPGTAETRHFVSSAEFGAMKEGSIFISMGRGLAVDEAALCEALRAGVIAGAALDVFEVEPLPTSSPLWDCPNLLLTAHNADFTEDYFKLGWEVWARNLRCYLEGQPLATPVDKRAGY